MRTLKFTDPEENYTGFGYLELKVDTAGSSADNCTIYEISSDDLDACRRAGLAIPVPYVTSLTYLKSLASTLGLNLLSVEDNQTLVAGVELPSSVTISDITGKAGEEIDLTQELTILPEGEDVEDLVIENLVFTVTPVEGEVLASVDGTTLTLLAVGETTVQFETIGKYGQRIRGSFALEVTTPYPETVTFTEDTLTGVAAETINLLDEIEWTPLNTPTGEYVEQNIQFSSDDELVATVEDGVLTLVGAGTATITLTVEVEEGSPAITDTIALTVTGGE